MGQAGVFLVGTHRWTGIVTALAVLASCRAAPETIVSADRYDAFWLWAGVSPQPVLARAKTLYILAGEVTARDPGRLVLLRPGVPDIGGCDLWLVVRVETLRWGPGVLETLVARLAQWRLAGNRVIGVQIDFDARTRHLDEYAAFLRDLRLRLPRGAKLGITGLLDWSANGDPQQLLALGNTIDEIVLQTYQGRRTIPGYDGYLARLGRFTRPFKIGLVQGGAWREPAALRANPQFKGYVVFLVNPPTREDRGRMMQH